MTRDVIVPVTTEVFERYRAGSKTVEVRNATSPVAAQIRKAAPGCVVRIRRGHNPANGEILATLGRVITAHGWASVPEWAQRAADVPPRKPGQAPYFDAVGDLVAFEVLIGRVAA